MKLRLKLHCPPRRGRPWPLALAALAAGLLAAPAKAQSFYEASGRSYFFGMGDTRAAVPGATVDVATGALLVKFPLLPLPSRYPHQVALYFNSQDGSAGPLGSGSSLSTSVVAATGASGALNVIFPGHRRFEFTYNWSTSAYEDHRDPEMLGAQFTQGPGQYGWAGTLTLRNGDQWQFDNQGNCDQEQDRHGNFINIDGAPFTQAVRYGGSYYPRADFAYTNGLLTSITYTYTTSNPPSRSWTLAYDASGHLSTITDPKGGVWHYTWTSYTRSDGRVLPLISTITTPRGNTILSAQYDTSGRITQYTAADTGVTHFSYSAALGADGTTTLTDPLSHATSWSYTWPAPPVGETAKFGYRLTSTVDPLGRQTQLAATHTGSNLITQITDYRNRVTTQNWDYAMGNLLSRTTPSASGGTGTASWTYVTAYNQVSSVTDPLGRQATATVDATTGNTTLTRDARGYSTTYGYDATTGDLTRITNPLGQNRYMSYDYYGDLLRVTDGTNTLYSATYDSAARKTSETDANGKTTSYGYDSLDRLVSVSRTVAGQAATTSFQYDADSNKISLTDPKGQVWQWQFDSRDRPWKAINPLGQTATFQYDLANTLSTLTDRVGNTSAYTYDVGSRPLTATYTNAGGQLDSVVTYTYDPATHRLASCTDTAAPGNQTWSWGYDSLDRATSVSSPYGTVTATLNDKINRREGLQAGSQGAITYGFDNNDNVISISQNGQTATLSYDPLNRLSQQSLPATPNPVVTSWGFNSLGFVTSVVSQRSGVTLDSHVYTRDSVGNITQEAISGQSTSTSTFGYDDLYRLTSSNVGGTASSWVYDLVGNRLSQTVGGATTSYTFDAADRLLTVNGVAVTSDANGSVINDDSGGTYTWDVRGRLRTLTKGGNTYQFQYTPDNLRAYKSLNGVATTYLLDGGHVVTETINGTPYQTLYGPGTDHALARNGEYFLPNQLGSTTALTDGAGNVTQSYQYEPFGQTTGGGTDTNPFQFTGRENDGASGLMYYRSRYYNPAWGRFISADPSGFGGGINPYAYCGNNPVSSTDPSGLSPEDGEPTPIPGGNDPTANPDPTVMNPLGLDENPPPIGNAPPPQAVPPAGDAVPEPAPPETAPAESTPTGGSGPYSGGTPTGNVQVVYVGPVGGGGSSLLPLLYYPENSGFEGLPTTITLPPGTVLWRYGGSWGTFVTDPGTLPWQCALPGGSMASNQLATAYITTDFIPFVQAGPAAAAFGQTGGGMQYKLPYSIDYYLQGYRMMKQ